MSRRRKQDRSNRAGSGKLARALSSEHSIAQHAAGDDFAYARAAGMTIKLLARCRVFEDGSVSAMVAPFMLPVEHPLGRVDDVFNGVQVTCSMEAFARTKNRFLVCDTSTTSASSDDQPCITVLPGCMQAQELGYAERNPEADVEGLDAGRKIAILADMLTGKNVDGQELGPVLRHQLLVGGAHALSCLQRLLRELIRRAHAPHDLAQDAYLRVVQNRSEPLQQGAGGEARGRVPGHREEDEVQLYVVARNNLHNTAAHGPVSQHCYFYHRSSSPLSRLSLGLTAPWQLTPGDICPSRPARFPELPESAPLRPSPPARWPLLFCCCAQREAAP